MPRADQPRPKAPAKPQRPVGRPRRFTPQLAGRICGLIATGSTLRAAAKACGVSWRTVARWNLERPEFREGYEQARQTRTLLWAEECIEIVDNTQGDYAKNPKTGKFEFNRENVLRAKLRVDERHWQMARLDPRLWGNRQEVHVKEDWSKLTVEERERRALAIIHKSQEIVAMRKDLERIRAGRRREITYDPTEAEDLDSEENPQGGGRRIRNVGNRDPG